MTRTCMACRARKMRCDGETPVCGPCSRARKPVECSYDETSVLQRKVALLQKGAACLPCRRKKKKCDAKRPFCNTCHAAGKEKDCEYDEEARQNLATVLLSRTRELEERLALYEAQEQHMSQPPTLSTGVPVDLAAQLGWHQPTTPFILSNNDHSSFRAAFLGSSSPETLSSSDSTTALSNFARGLLSEIAIRPSEGTGQICQSSSELRSLFLSHQAQMGLYLRPAKWQAVKDGDFSGRVVHRGVVHLSQLVGSLLWRLHHKTEVLIMFEADELQNLSASLAYSPDPATLVSIYTILSWYFLWERKLDTGRQHLAKASDIIILNNLQLSMQTMDDILASEEPDEDAKEYITSFCQLLYMDKAATLVIGMAPLMGPQFDGQFKSLAFMQPWLCKHSVVVMRCKSIILLQESMRLSRVRAEVITSSASRVLDHTLPSEWHTQYWDMLEDVSQHVALLYPRMLQASLCEDLRNGLCLKVCIIIALAAQVELHRMPGSYHDESRQKTLSVILEVIGLAKGLKDDDYALLEPILGICFTIVANALRGDSDLLINVSQGEAASGAKNKEALSVLIASATQLATKLPYVERSLQTLCQIASKQ